jgi:hypothetical protein
VTRFGETRYLVAGRREGRTTALLAWLLAGEPTDHWMTWSRVVLIPGHDMLMYTRDHFPDVDHELRERGCRGGLGKVLLSPGDVERGMWSRWDGLELAVDDGDELRFALGHLPIVPSLVVLCGTTTTIEEIAEEIIREAEEKIK